MCSTAPRDALKSRRADNATRSPSRPIRYAGTEDRVDERAEADCKNWHRSKGSLAGLACSDLTNEAAQFLQIGIGFGTLNPHLALSLKTPQGNISLAPTSPRGRSGFPRGRPLHTGTASRISAVSLRPTSHTTRTPNGSGRREFVAEFSGLSGSAKQKAVLDSVGLSRAPLSAMAADGQLDLDTIRALRIAMQRESRAIKPAALGIIGEDHLRQRLCLLRGGDIDTFRYSRNSAQPTGCPRHRGRLAYAPGDDDRSVIAGVVWSPSVHGVPFDSLGRDWTLAALLQEQRCGRGEPIILAVHLAIPRVSFPTLGKSGTL